MKHLHIVNPYGSAAMQRMTQPLLDYLPALYEVTTSAEVDTAADLNYHCPWHTLAGLEDRGTGRHVIEYTHCNAGSEAALLDACERADLVTAMSFQGRKELIDLGVDPVKIWVIYAAAEGFSYRPRVIGIVGYPQPNGRKRESLLLDLAWKHDLSAFQFLFLGAGWETMVTQLTSLGVNASTVHADTPQKIAQAYQLMDALLVTGYTEGGPLPLLEAMASGARVLSPRFGYGADLLPDGDIYDTPESLMRILENMTCNSVNGHLLARAWSWKDYAAEHALIFGRLLGESVDLFPERGASRYAQLLDVINELKPRSIVEIGTWNGNRAIQMIQQASRYHPIYDMEYRGFDLFETQTRDDLRREFSKGGWPMEIVHRRIEATRAIVELFLGSSRETLPAHMRQDADLYFIDGGHSEQTIESDGLMVLDNMQDYAVAIFDDYYHAGAPEEVGCNAFIDALDRSLYEVTQLPARTNAEGGRIIGMVKVRKHDASLPVPMLEQARNITYS